jgi:archaemetzincin
MPVASRRRVCFAARGLGDGGRQSVVIGMMDTRLNRISIVPVNAIDSAFLTRLGLCLEERFLFSCVVEGPVTVSPTALNSVRKQLFLGTLLSKVSAGSPNGGYRLAITEFDLYKTSHQFIFGDGNEDSRLIAVSLHRLRTEFYGEDADANLLFQRTLKESVHNVGHALGLKHCYNARCAMFLSGSIYDTDNKLSHFCDVCERRMRKALTG